MKCDNHDCCKTMRSSWLAVVPTRFLRPPIQIVQSLTGLQLSNPEQHDGKTFSEFKLAQYLKIKSSLDINNLPYDLFCPSVKSEVQDRTCKDCGIYFCSKRAVADHRRALHKKNKKNGLDEKDELITSELNSPQNTDASKAAANSDLAPFISIEQTLDSPWIEDED